MRSANGLLDVCACLEYSRKLRILRIFVRGEKDLSNGVGSGGSRRRQKRGKVEMIWTKSDTLSPTVLTRIQESPSRNLRQEEARDPSIRRVNQLEPRK